MGKLLLILGLCCLFAFTVEAQTFYCQTCNCPACWIWFWTGSSWVRSSSPSGFVWEEETPSSTCTQTSCDTWCQEACEDIYGYYTYAYGVWTYCNIYGVTPSCGYGSCSTSACWNKKRDASNTTEIFPRISREAETFTFPVQSIVDEAAVAKRNPDAAETFTVPVETIVEEAKEDAVKRDAETWPHDLMTPVRYLSGTPEYEDIAPAYLGCYADESTRDLNVASSTSGITGHTACIKYCSGVQTAFAGVQAGSQCFCGNHYGTYGTSTGCNNACSNPGTRAISDLEKRATNNGTPAAETLPQRPCGGSWANDVWTTGFQGCWGDGSSPRDLPYTLSGGSSSMTVTVCRSGCHSAGYLYAGLQYGSQCFCGNHYGQNGYGQTPGNCGMACAGDSTQKCGGAYSNAVFTSIE